MTNRTLEEIANDPRPGDVVANNGFRYTVRRVGFDDVKLTAHQRNFSKVITMRAASWKAICANGRLPEGQ
jgi:hypothetical protein